MATSRRKSSPSRTSLKRRVETTLGPPADRKLLVQLLTEMQYIVLDAGSSFGATPAEARRAVKIAQSDLKRLRPSRVTLQMIDGISGLLACWWQDKRFRIADGTPRVLSITGKGATFETLAHKFLPGVPLNQVLELICANAEVTRMAGDKVALLGSPVMIEPKTPEIQLASLVLRFRRLTETTLHNAAIPARVKVTGRFERVVTGELSDKAFERLSRRIRTQLQATCDHIDACIPQLSAFGRPRANRKACGIGMYVFKDDGTVG